MIENFDHLSSNSRAWTYKSNRPITPEEQEQIRFNLDGFIREWAAHGSELKGVYAVNEWFIALAVDENFHGASGCSIDSSVKQIKLIGNELNIDFFNRLNVLVQKDDVTQEIHFSTLGEFNDWNVYNPMVSTVGELRSNWLIPAASFSF